MRPSPHPRLAIAIAALLVASAVACAEEDFDQRRAAALEAQSRLYEGDYPFRPPTEVEKIEALIQHVRGSGATFFRRDRELTPGLAAAWMERRYFTRWGRQIGDAAQFVGIVSERPTWSSRPFLMRHTDGEEQLVRDFLFAELERLEQAPGPFVDRIMDPEPVPVVRESGKAPTHPIEQALTRIEQAPTSVSFVVVDRSGAREQIDGPAMAKSLRTKTRWLGADLDSVEVWIDEIATRDFMSYRPYEVETEGTTTGSLADWLRIPPNIEDAGAPTP